MCGIDCSGTPGGYGLLIGDCMLGKCDFQADSESSIVCRGRQAAVDVAEAVAYLHSLPVVHSDLKSR